MNKKITFRGKEHSQVLDDHINQQLEKVEAFLEYEKSPINIEVVVEFHEVHKHHKVTAHVRSPHHHCHCEHEGPDVHVEINKVIDRLYSQLRNEKQKLVKNHKNGCDKECRDEMFKASEEAAQDSEE